MRDTRRHHPYLVAERDRAGWATRTVDAAWQAKRGTKGQMAGHWFGATQWALPTADHYEWLRRLFNADGGDYLRREYDDLRREYDDLRRPFTVTADVPYTDVWTYPTVPPARKGTRRHPCEKPVDMMRHIIRTSSRPGDLVLDCFLGSGATAIAARDLGRRFIGCDMDPAWIEHTERRLAEQDAMPQQMTLDADGVAA